MAPITLEGLSQGTRPALKLLVPVQRTLSDASVSTASSRTLADSVPSSPTVTSISSPISKLPLPTSLAGDSPNLINNFLACVAAGTKRILGGDEFPAWISGWIDIVAAQINQLREEGMSFVGAVVMTLPGGVLGFIALIWAWWMWWCVLMYLLSKFLAAADVVERPVEASERIAQTADEKGGMGRVAGKPG